MDHRRQSSRKLHAGEGGAPQIPALAPRNFAWWSRVYGARFRLSAAESPPLHEQQRELFAAIRENRRAAVEAIVLRHPHLTFGKRRDLRCEGFLPAEVAGFGRDHAIDRMKVQFLLGEEARPRVVVCTEDAATIHSSSIAVAPGSVLRLQIHFSEPVEDFIRDDLAVSACVSVRSFAKLRSDLFVVDVVVLESDKELASGSAAGSDVAFVEVPDGAARSASLRGVGGRGGALSTRSNRFLLRRPSSPPLPTAS
ncbi:hypothetical protein PybrP1_010131 [[Pythium] brassicae (nom. inval.)]|nr:hypothetical protein PybrP1_010131 [[Pythium] brassicae (nom. inval.)]